MEIWLNSGNVVGIVEDLDIYYIYLRKKCAIHSDLKIPDRCSYKRLKSKFWNIFILRL